MSFVAKLGTPDPPSGLFSPGVFGGVDRRRNGGERGVPVAYILLKLLRNRLMGGGRSRSCRPSIRGL